MGDQRLHYQVWLPEEEIPSRSRCNIKFYICCCLFIVWGLILLSSVPSTFGIGGQHWVLEAAVTLSSWHVQRARASQSFALRRTQRSTQLGRIGHSTQSNAKKFTPAIALADVSSSPYNPAASRQASNVNVASVPEDDLSGSALRSHAHRAAHNMSWDSGALEAWRVFEVSPPAAVARVKAVRFGGDLGIGVVAADNIKRGDTLVRVPLRSCVMVERSEDDDVELSLALLLRLQKDNAWVLYRDAVLPHESELGASFLWSLEERSWLQHQPAIAAAERIAKRVEALHATIKQRIRASQDDDDDTDEIAKLATAEGEENFVRQAEWAMATVLSRSVALHDVSGQERLRALIPIEDLFNHIPESPAEYIAAANLAGADEPPSPWVLEDSCAQEIGPGLLDVEALCKGSASVMVRAPYDVALGEQVMLTYGLETNADLLTTHGFVLDHNSAEYVPLFQNVNAMAEVYAVAFPHASEAAEDAAPEASALGKISDQEVEVGEAQLGVLRDMDAYQAPLAVRPGVDMAACAHVLGAAMVLAATPSELHAFHDGWSDTVGHAVLTPTIASGADASIGLPLVRVQQLERRSCAFLGGVADAELDELERRSTMEADMKDIVELRKLLDDQIGMRDRSPRELLTLRRKLLALRYREGVKRSLYNFVRRCEARHSELGGAELDADTMPHLP